MARRVLNTTVSGGAAILNVSCTKTSTLAISSANNEWKSSAGFSWTHTRSRTDSYSFSKLAWAGGESIASYFAGMGMRATHPSTNTSTRFGWSYYWRHNGTGGDGTQHLFSMMNGWDPSDFDNEDGNHLMQIGWTSTNGGNNQPSARWCETRAQDSRGNANNQAYAWQIEVNPDNVGWQVNDGGNS